MVTTFAPTRCGIGSFAASLSNALGGQGVEVDVVRLLQTGDVPGSSSRVSMEFDPSRTTSVTRASKVLDRYPTVIVQHEFGIFGPSDGEAAADLAEAVSSQVVTVLHSVPLRPEPLKRRIVARLAKASSLVVPSHAARVALEDLYGVPAETVAVIPHGSSWSPTELNSGPRRRLLTWGLLGPGKGVERGIAAVDKLGDLFADGLRYSIVGQTHPNVVRREGFRYRETLERLISYRRLEGVVTLDEGYKTDADLYRVVAAADVIVIPYDNDEQICSGVLTEAVAAGKPVVATKFPHATELLGGGAGLVVGHEDPGEMANAIRMLLTDEMAYQRAVGRARLASSRLAWSEVARRYREYFARLSDSLAVS